MVGYLVGGDVPIGTSHTSEKGKLTAQQSAFEPYIFHKPAGTCFCVVKENIERRIDERFS